MKAKLNERCETGNERGENRINERDEQYEQNLQKRRVSLCERSSDEAEPPPPATTIEGFRRDPGLSKFNIGSVRKLI